MMTTPRNLVPSIDAVNGRPLGIGVAGGRLAVELAGTSPTLHVGLNRRETIAFDTADVPVSVRVLDGSIWLTDDGIDRVLAAGQSLRCSPRQRVVITALSAGQIDVSVGDLS